MISPTQGMHTRLLYGTVANQKSCGLEGQPIVLFPAVNQLSLQGRYFSMIFRVCFLDMPFEGEFPAKDNTKIA